MGLLDWMKPGRAGGRQSVAEAPRTFLSRGERAALKRLIGHFDDGLFGWNKGKPRAWEADLEGTAERLGFRDRFGAEPVRLSEKEARAINHFQRVCEKDAADLGSSQMKADICSLKSGIGDGRKAPGTQGEGAGQVERE